jgi:hypothetical protein
MRLLDVRTVKSVACGSGALSAAFSQGVMTADFMADLRQDGVLGLIASSSVGRTASVLGGGIADGARTAAFGYIFNCLGRKESCAHLFAKAGTLVGAAGGGRLAQDAM